MNDFNERLRAERKRLGLNQEKFAALGGVAKDAQLNYEKGSRKPDSDYLVAVAAAGVDILYLLTGELASLVLPADEKELLTGYRGLDIRNKANMLGMLDVFGTTPAAQKPATSAKNYAVNHGEIKNQTVGDVTSPQNFYMGSDNNTDTKKPKKKLAK